MRTMFTPLKIAGMEVKNRTFMAPMSLGYESQDGTVNEKMEAYWLRRAQGGVGCIIVDATSVDPNVPYLGNTLCFRDEESIKKYKSFTDKVHSYGCKIIPQITHPGPESISAFFGVAPVASSSYPNSMGQMTRELAKEELSESKKRVEELEQELKILLLPKDPNDDKNVIVEIRAGAGGDEAALFAAEIYRMYVHYADSRRWKTEMISLNENGIGGFKEVVFMITGQGAYSRMKYESGVHRVQRVPETESGGRIHTSTITVAVMPEAEEVDVVIDEKDIRIDVMRASGNGGQCVNTTDSAVRLTHYPTGIVIYSQTEKSQLQNKDKAFALLRAKLYDLECQKRHDAEAEARKSQIGTGDRSEKIRTYNFPQGRVTDHRIGLTLYKLDKIMNGDIQEIIDACIAADQAAKLANMNEEM